MSDLLLLLSSLHMNFCSLSELTVYELLLSLRAHYMIYCSSMIYTFDNKNSGKELLTASDFLGESILPQLGWSQRHKLIDQGS